MSEFERSDQLLKNEKEANEDDSDGFPIWIIIMIASIVVVFAIIICSICYMMRKNRQSRDLQDNVIIREIALAKAEGVQIPDDLEKRLSRLQSVEESEGKGKRKGGGKLCEN